MTRSPSLFFALFWACAIPVWAAETNPPDLLGDPTLFYNLSRTNPATLQALVEAQTRKYGQTVINGRRTIPYAQQFSELFTNRQEFISYYTGAFGPQTWNSKAGLYGRYVLSMQMRIRMDKTGTNIVNFEPPSFLLREITRIRNSPKDPGGGGQLLLDGVPQSTRRFSAAEWEQLVKSRGDLSVLGFQVDTNHPVQGFELNWKRF